MSDPTGSSLPVALQSRREQTITALCEHFAQDRLTLEEFEQRLDVANRAVTVPDLDSLLSDLPALASADVPAPSAALARPSAHAHEDQTFFAIMGGIDRRGHWQPARSTTVITLMGGASLDFREASLPAGETEVTIIAVMGGAEIIVPPGMHIDVGGMAIMGGFDHAENVSSPPDPNAPLLRINGFVLMGGVEVQVRLAGETAKDTKRREREEKRRQRDERRRR
jgi:hypothetical protein